MGRDLTSGKSANMIKNIASKSREESGKKTVKNIALDLIDMSEDNDKIFNCDDLDSLVDTIKRNGFQGTIEVYLKKDGRYGLLSGHRRYLSVKRLGLEEIPCEVIEEPSETQKAEILIMSNIQARNLSPIEMGKALIYYEENVLKKDKSIKGDKRAELGKRFGITGSQVYKYKALVNLIPPLQQLIEDKAVSYAYIYNVANLDKDTQEKVYEEISKSQKAEEEPISGKDISDIVNKITNSGAEEDKEESIVLKDDVSPTLTDDAPKEKEEKSPLDDEIKAINDCQNLKALIKRMVDKGKLKTDNKEVIEKLNELKDLLTKIL